MTARLFGVTLGAALVLSCSSVQAQRLPGGIRPEHYDLSFDVDLANARFMGQATIAVQVSAPSTRIVLNAAELTFEHAIVSAAGVEQPATTTINRATETVTLSVPRAVPPGPAEIRIKYRGVLGNELRGFYLSTEGSRRYGVTQFESTDARRAFPGFDEPSYKATFSITLTIPDGETAISNGRVISDTPGPAPGTHTLRFSRTPKMSSYLVAMAVGDFACLEGASDTIPIRVCAIAGKKFMGSLALDAAKRILSYLNRYFSIPYPFEKLDIVAVPDFAAGAMENTAAIFFREADLLSASASPPVETEKRIWSVIAHEMAHQWFGNLVTMAWWDDLWLNEGFATWMEKRPVEVLHPEWRMDLERVSDTQRVMVVDELASTRAIHTKVETPAEIEETFDAIAYEKGAAVVRMVEGYVGGQAFRLAVNAYLERHAYGNATSADFWTIVSAVSGKPVDRILPTFVNQAGVPLVTASIECAGDRAELRTKTTRFFTGKPLAASPLWQIPICVKTASSGPVTCKLADGPSASLPLEATGCPSWAFINPGGRGYFRTAYAPSLLSALARDVNTQLTAPERLTLVGDEWALVKAARHSAGDYLTLVSGFGEEPTNAVLSEVSRRLDFIHANLTTTASRPAFERFVQSLFRPMAAGLGFRETEREGDETRARRATVVATLGGAGNDPALAEEALRLVDAALTGSQPLDATSAETIIALAARRGDAVLWQRFLDASKAALDPTERYRYLYGLARFTDVSLIDRGLALALTPDVRSQDAGTYLNRFLSNAVARDRAWAFVKRNWTMLKPKLTVSFGEGRLVQGLGTYCDAQARDDIRRFFGSNPLRYATRTLEQTLETMNGCIAMRQRGTADVSAWLSAR